MDLVGYGQSVGWEERLGNWDDLGRYARIEYYEKHLEWLDNIQVMPDDECSDWIAAHKLIDHLHKDSMRLDDDYSDAFMVRLNIRHKDRLIATKEGQKHFKYLQETGQQLCTGSNKYVKESMKKRSS